MGIHDFDCVTEKEKILSKIFQVFDQLQR